MAFKRTLLLLLPVDRAIWGPSLTASTTLLLSPPSKLSGCSSTLPMLHVARKLASEPSSV